MGTRKPRSEGTIVSKKANPPLTIPTLADYPWTSEDPSLWNSNICNLTDVWAAIMSELGGSFDLYLL